jgi:Predicted periplasmic ligand-binding sensor domain
MLSLPLQVLVCQPLQFRTIDINNGLSHNMINAIYKDIRGFVWLGTQLGLDRFDGIKVTNFPLLNGYSVYSICETEPVFLWLGTDKGLIKMNRTTEEIEQIDLDNKQSYVRFIYPLSDNRVMIGSQHGLFILDGKKKMKFMFDPNPVSNSNSITKIIPAKEEGCYWMTSLSGLIYFNSKDGTSTLYKPSLTDDSLNAFSCIIEVNNTLFIGTRTHGIVTFNSKAKQFSNFPYKGNGYITTLSVAGEGSLYVGTNGGGLITVDNHTGEILSVIEHKNDETSISSNAVYSFLQDDDILWIGTYMGGLNYNPTHGDLFSVYNFRNKFNSSNYNIRSFHISDDGEMLVGTRDGFFYISETQDVVKHYNTKTSILQSDIILGVSKLNNYYLIGTYGGGLYRFNPQDMRLDWFLDAPNFKQGSFCEFIKDDCGKIWIAASNGVCVFDPETKQYIQYNTTNSGLNNSSIFCALKDSKGQIWFGTGASVFMYDPRSRVFRSDMFPAHMLPYLNNVRYIYEDSDSNMWFCNDKEGIVKVDKAFSTFNHFTTDDFLPSNSVTSIIEDANKGMWFASQRGLVYKSPDTGQTIFYSLFDGIPGYIFNPCVHLGNDGTIWWGNEQGLVFYNHRNKKKEKKRFPPAITSVSVAGKALRARDGDFPLFSSYISGLEIPSDKSLEFSFSALNYSIYNTDIYEYILEGYEKIWNILMSGNKAFYEKLPPGEYIFHIKSSSAPELITSIKVKVKRNIPSTVWIILIVVISCLVLIYSYTRLLGKYRGMKENQQLKKQEQQHIKYARSKVEEPEASIIIDRLNAYMDKDKPYLNPELKLQDVAEATQCISVELSQVLNMYLQTNFTDYINHYRVEEFIKRVQDKSAVRYTLTTLSEESGFSSRTSFFRSFKKHKGKTPAEYIKDMGIELRK